MYWAWFLPLPIFLLVAVGALALVLITRTNPSQVVKEMGIEIAPIVDNGQHNAFTDLVLWKDYFYLVYCSSPTHFASKRSCMVVVRSRDSKQWEEISRLHYGGIDIRDPKFAVVRDTLFIYALLNKSFDPEPYRTVISHSTDGYTWSPFTDRLPSGWLFGRPKSFDGETWYAPAHWHTFDKVGLFMSADGDNWVMVSTIISRDGVDETAIEFMPDGKMLAAIRFQRGNAVTGSPQNSTVLVESGPPYSNWSRPETGSSTRMDGPNLLRVGKYILAAARSQPEHGKPFLEEGSALSKKRTSLFMVTPEKITHLFELPSGGDTSYAGIVEKNDNIFISYYSSPLKHDLPWILGMLFPTGIYLAKCGKNMLFELMERKGAF